MFKKIGAVSIGVLIGLVIAFARAGAFPFWNENTNQASPGPSASPQAQPAAPRAPGEAAAPAPANAPEPGERMAGVVNSFAPLVKRVMPTVVNVSVVQDVKVQGFGGVPFRSEERRVGREGGALG